MANVIIGTAGHVDHGKTELVRALTGKDTDRLEEEKQRGISIVLGFAPLDLGGGITAGVVDVPGHERFVKNMVSGAVGVDIALMVVAADEGVMPQTEEHLEVLRLLGVGSGVIAITKTDLVDEDISEVVESEITDMLAGTSLGDAPLVRTSVVTGVGIEEIREALGRQVEKIGERDTGDFFRMPVDRIFTRSGIGTIVTGTTWDGTVRKGDDLVIEPSGRAVRARDVHSFDRTVDRAATGMRTAIAVHGVKVEEVTIGCQVLTPGVLKKSSMLDAVVEIGRLAGSRLRNKQRVRFHHAAAEIMARAIILDKEELESGDRGFIQLRLEKPTVARRGDRFVLRSYSPMHVIAGGKILDPVAVKAKRFRRGMIETLESLDGGSLRDVVQTLALRGDILGVSSIQFRRFGLTGADASTACRELESEGMVFSVGDYFFDASVVKAKEEELLDIVEKYASGNRLLWGIDREELKEKAGLIDGPLFDFLLNRGKEEGRLFFKGGRVRSGSAERDLSPDDRKMLAKLERIIKEYGFTFPGRGDLLEVVRDEKRLNLYLHILQEGGSVVKISADGFLHAEPHVKLLDGLRKSLREGQTITVGDFKDMFGFSRKYAVPILEYLDNEGFTVREKDVRAAGHRLREVEGEG